MLYSVHTHTDGQLKPCLHFFNALLKTVGYLWKTADDKLEVSKISECYAIY